jgi:hypothetical protein
MQKRKIMRKIYGPVTENNIWRIRYNEEINSLLKGENTYQVTENKWLGHVERMVDNAMPKRILKGRLIPKAEKEDPA